MQKIYIKPDELRILAKTYNNCSELIQKIIHELSKTQEDLSLVWEGKGYVEFENQFYKIKPEMQEFSILLEDIYMRLNEIALVIEETDRSIAHSILKNGIS